MIRERSEARTLLGALGATECGASKFRTGSSIGRSAGLRNRRLKVRILPSALTMQVIVSATLTLQIALVAQWRSYRLLTGRLQVQVLPGALQRMCDRHGTPDIAVSRGRLRAVVAQPTKSAAAGRAGGAAQFPAAHGVTAAGEIPGRGDADEQETVGFSK